MRFSYIDKTPNTSTPHMRNSRESESVTENNAASIAACSPIGSNRLLHATPSHADDHSYANKQLHATHGNAALRLDSRSLHTTISQSERSSEVIAVERHSIYPASARPQKHGPAHAAAACNNGWITYSLRQYHLNQVHGRNARSAGCDRLRRRRRQLRLTTTHRVSNPIQSLLLQKHFTDLLRLGNEESTSKMNRRWPHSACSTKFGSGYVMR